MKGKKGAKKGKKRKDVLLTERKKLSASERIKELEEEIRKIKYNKRTQRAIGLLKAKLAVLKERALQRSSIGKSKGDDRFNVRKTGDCTAILLGFPSVGKSTLLNKLTNAKSDIASYSFTTLNAVPGLMKYRHARIQIIDVPGIVSGSASGRGRGKEVLSMLRNADLILILIDALYPEHYKAVLKEVYKVGIRINQQKPYIRVTKKERGGVLVTSTVGFTNIDEQTIIDIAKEMKINNADILIRDYIDTGQLIDAIEGNKVYTKSLTVITKIDLVDGEKLRKLKNEIRPDVVLSAEKGIGVEELKQAIFDKMGFIRIYLKEVNKKPDLEEPLIMFKGSTIRDVCSKLHRDFVNSFRYARLWGSSAKFDGQVFKKLNKKLEDEDILELHIR